MNGLHYTAAVNLIAILTNKPQMLRLTHYFTQKAYNIVASKGIIAPL